MFDFTATGDIEAVIMQQDNKGHIVRLRCMSNFKFPKAGETPAALAVQIINAQLVKGLSVGQRITVSGPGAVGEHDWEKPAKFGQKPTTKAIQNFYFQATKVEVAKA